MSLVPNFASNLDNRNIVQSVVQPIIKKRWPCSDCEKTFSRRHDMIRHRRQFHASNASENASPSNQIQSMEQFYQQQRDKHPVESNSMKSPSSGYEISSEFPGVRLYNDSFQHPFTCIVAGPTGSGKSHLVRSIIRAKRKLIIPEPTRVMWAYGIETEVVNNMRITNNDTDDDDGYDDCEIEYVAGLPDHNRLH